MREGGRGGSVELQTTSGIASSLSHNVERGGTFKQRSRHQQPENHVATREQSPVGRLVALTGQPPLLAMSSPTRLGVSS